MDGLLEIDLKSSRSLIALQCIKGGAKTRDGMMGDMLEWVIVVEFDPLVRALLSEWLEEAGMRVLAFDAPDALPMISTCLIIVDLAHIRQSSADIIRRVRTLYPGVPLLGLSTQAREGTGVGSEVARRLGVDMLLPKPCERLILVRAAKALMTKT